eukprot:57499-Prorocentrum_minimum.AAC.1
MSAHRAGKGVAGGDEALADALPAEEVPAGGDAGALREIHTKRALRHLPLHAGQQLVAGGGLELLRGGEVGGGSVVSGLLPAAERRVVARLDTGEGVAITTQSSEK